MRPAAVAELVYAMVSKAIAPIGACGFESHPPHLARPLAERQLVDFLAGEELNASQIASIAGIPRSMEPVEDGVGSALQKRCVAR
jgi:hypothetical protein